MEVYRASSKDILEQIRSSEEGLTSAEAQRRVAQYGPNSIELKKKTTFGKLLLRQFKSYLIWLLFFLVIFALFSGLYLQEQEQIIDAVIIFAIIIINTFIGAYQDYRSEKSAELLQSMLKTQAVVLRDGSKTTLDSSELVPGDINKLAAGDKVPADCRIIECKDCYVDESILTGESQAVLKSFAPIDKTVPLAEQHNMIFMNTFVTRGSATCVVTGTGKGTEVGRIAEALDEKENASPFMQEVDVASKKITYIAFVLVVIASAIFFWHDRHWITVFMVASALIIGSIPEGLPAIVTFALSMGSRNLAKNNVLVKRRSLLETLGSVDTICTDKTGTLTENKMTVKRLFFDGKDADSLSALNQGTKGIFSRCALLCNEAKSTDKGFVGDAEDIALIDLFGLHGTDIQSLQKQYPATKFEPFSSERKCARSYNQMGKAIVRYTKGAPEVVLDASKYILREGKAQRMTQQDRDRIIATMKAFSGQALRLIAFSYKEIKTDKEAQKSELASDVFIGLVGMYDRPKATIRETVQTIYGAGIDLKMITGDNEDTAVAIAKECGFSNIQSISWQELNNLSEPMLRKKIAECNVFARMSPEFKHKIVSILQESGRRVAITGDGVNDVPALKKADVGVAMGLRGSDIAKEAGDMIILDDNLHSIVAGIKQGRTIFSNIRKVINYLLTANLAEVFVVFFSSMLGLIPFLAIHLLWANFVTDVVPAMALGVDPPHKDIMKKRPAGKKEKLINKRIAYLTIFIGLKKVVVMLAIFLGTLQLTGNLVLGQTMSFTYLVLSHFVRVAAIRFDEKVNFFVNKFLNWSLFVPLVLQLLIIYTPLAAFFHVMPLTAIPWAVLGAGIILEIGLARMITAMITRHLAREEFDY